MSKTNSCNLYCELRRGESSQNLLKRWFRLMKKTKLKDELIEKSALTRRHKDKSVKKREKREKAERERQRAARKRENRKSKGSDQRR